MFLPYREKGVAPLLPPPGIFRQPV